MDLQEEVKELRALVSILLAKQEVLEQENSVLKAENADLRARLGLNSGNSHQPPSSDGLSKKPSVALAKERGKKSGGQPGHAGHYLKMVDQPDVVMLHHAPSCCCCQQVFVSSQIEYILEKRQVVDIPPASVVVTEHQLGVITCCGQPHLGTFPSDVRACVQYGSRIQAMSSLLNTDFRLPLEKISQLFFDLYGCSYNPGTVIRANEQLYQALAPIEADLKQQLLQSEVAHFDETGMRVAGKLHWFHTACSGLLCYLFVHAKRGKQALQAQESLLKDFQHWAVHDCWASYFAFKHCQHALCNAHLLRELTHLQEQGSEWAPQMHTLLLDLYKASEKASKVLDNQASWIERYQHICQQAHQEEPLPRAAARGKPKNSKGRNLLNRLVSHQAAVLAFAWEEAVPFTNNPAEQAIRCIKVKQKVAMSFRTLKGAKVFARIQGFVTTCRKQKLNVFQQLLLVLNNNTPACCTS
jgi:transposase